MQVELREIERSDLPTINRWRNDPEVVQYLGANFHFIGSEIDEKWFDNYLASKDSNVRLAIVEPERKQLVGCVYLLNIHRINRSAELAIVIGEKDFRSLGYGTYATEAMLRHAFQDLNLHRVYLTVLSDNLKAIRMYEKAGFRHEGCQRDAVFKGKAYRDVAIMSILASEFGDAHSK